MTDPTERGDDVLAAEAASGGREAFAELVARYAPRVVAVLRQRVGDGHLAEDLAQEVWIKAHGGLGRLERGAAFRPWLFAVALNHARDALRSRSRGKVLYLPDVSAHAPVVGPDRAPETDDERRRVERALGRLDEPFRTALALVDLGGLSYAEAAASAGCELGTMKSRVHRARRAFRDAWSRADAGRRHPKDTCGSLP